MRVDYDLEVYCHKCGVRHLKEDCKLIQRFGWQCPFCGNKCRSQARYIKANRMKTHPYIPRNNPTIKTEIRALAKAERME
jgi:hypothetical protein